MSDLIRENEFIKVSLVQVEDKKINKDKVLDKVNQYLSENLIADEKYKCTRFNEFTSFSIEMELIRVGDDLYNDGYIDEDFESDDSFKAFCDEMKELIELKRFSVPYWYYSK